MNGAFWPVIGTLGDHPVRPGCQSIPKCISRVPGRARARAHMHPRQGLSPASRERLRTRIGCGPPCARIRSAARVYKGLGTRARSRPGAVACVCRERDLASAHRAREAPMRTHPRSGAWRACPRAVPRRGAYEGARLRARAPHACAQSCSRPRAHRPMRSRAGARRTPVRGRLQLCLRVFAVCGRVVRASSPA